MAPFDQEAPMRPLHFLPFPTPDIPDRRDPLRWPDDEEPTPEEPEPE